jgi:hypothetical protein
LAERGHIERPDPDPRAPQQANHNGHVKDQVGDVQRLSLGPAPSRSP